MKRRRSRPVRGTSTKGRSTTTFFAAGAPCARAKLSTGTWSRSVYHWPKRAEANAHLIAEAPQMLAILKELIRLECDLPPVLLRPIVVAIARAEGVKRMPRAGKVA